MGFCWSKADHIGRYIVVEVGTDYPRFPLQSVERNRNSMPTHFIQMWESKLRQLKLLCRGNYFSSLPVKGAEGDQLKCGHTPCKSNGKNYSWTQIGSVILHWNLSTLTPKSSVGHHKCTSVLHMSPPAFHFCHCLCPSENRNDIARLP